MAHRPTVEFLRRRYAAAILRDDADTAGRLRLQLDGLMNQAQGAGRLGEASQMEARRPLDTTAAPQALPAATGASGRREPRLRLVAPVTGLLEWPGLRRCEQ